MTFEHFIFYAFSVLLVFSAVLVVTVRNPVHAALSLVLAFFSSSALWLLLNAEFLAITLVLVYVGAVTVLFLFVVMMLDINIAKLREGFARYVPLGLGVAVLMVFTFLHVVRSGRFDLGHFAKPVAKAASYSNTRELGLQLYTTYVYPFEIASVVLLVAIVAAIALTLRRRPDSKYQSQDEQVAVKRADRVRLVEMPSEERK